MSRRGVLRAGAVAVSGIAGAGLLGCASRNSTPGTSDSPASITAGPSKSASQETPKRGGVLRYATKTNADTFDVLTSANTTANGPAGFSYSRLLKFAPGDGVAASGAVEGEVAEKWEMPDSSTLILHLRKNMKFDARPPTSGRVLTSADVMETLNVFAAKSVNASNLINKVSASASITKWEAVDDSTVKLSLAFPDGALLSFLASPWGVWVEPVEAMRGGFDPKGQMRGTGPFTLEEFKPNVSYKYKRNPDWYGGPDRPYVDAVELSIIPNAAQVEAQFKAGNFNFGGGLVPASDIPALVKSTPDSQIVTTVPTASGVWSFNLGAADLWKDERVRRAVSMAFDRNAFADVLYAPKNLEAFGLKTRTYWMSPLSPGLGAEWLDPSGKDFGPSGKYMQHDIAESRKMLAAAGFDDKRPLTFELDITPEYFPDWEARSQATQSLLAEAGIKMEIFNTPYTSDFVPNILRSKTKFKGHKMLAAVSPFAGAAKSCAAEGLSNYYSSWGGNTATGSNFPDLDKLITEQRRTLDAKERLAKTHDIQRYMVEHMVVMPAAAVIDLADVASKKLHGVGQWTSWGGGFTGFAAPAEVMNRYWLEA